MRVAGRGFIGSFLLQFVAALALAALLTLALWRIGPLAMLAALFGLLTLASLAATGVVRTRITQLRFSRRRRGRGWGSGWGQRGDGWDLTGVREPRRPRPPFYPARAEAVERPVPLQESELRNNLVTLTKGPEPKVMFQVGQFQVGQTVKIIDGPFAEYIGTVSEVAPERNKVTVLVSFFGRETPVQLDFLQIEQQ